MVNARSIVVNQQSAVTDSPRVRRYHRTRRLLSVAGFFLDLAVLVTLLFTGWTLAFRTYGERASHHPALALLVYLALFGLIIKVLGLPLDYLGGFWLERRYELSNLTLWGWVGDQLKGFMVGGLLGAPALEFLYWTLRRWPTYWWIISGTGFVAFYLLLANLAPIVIFPIFFKSKPLENPSLSERLLELARRASTRVQGVFEWKLSEKTKKANAALIGLGNTRRIVLADTLLEKFSEEEVEAVFAHELGHHVRFHPLQGLAVQVAASFLGLYLVNGSLLRFSRFFGFMGPADFANLPLLVLVSLGLSLVILPAVNAHSRSLERQADAYALRVISNSSAFISSMEKLAELNCAERRPHPWVEFFFHGHPSIEKRIAFAQKFPR